MFLKHDKKIEVYLDVNAQLQGWSIMLTQAKS